MENTWTSISKGFPKKRGEVWVTVPLGRYRILERSWYESGHFYITDTRLEIADVIAWMPMYRPDPYLGE